MHVPDAQLKTILAESGMLARKQFEELETEAHTQGRRVTDLLLGRSVIDEDELRRAHAQALGIPFVSVDAGAVPFDVLALVPEPIARTHGVIAYARAGARVEVALLDSDDLSAIGFLREHFTVLPRITDALSMRQSLARYQRFMHERFGNTVANAIKAFGTQTPAAGAAHLPAAQFVDTLLRHALLQHASDIHVEPQSGHIAIRYRIGGALHEAFQVPLAAHSPILARVKQLARLSSDAQITQEGRFVASVDGQQIAVRISVVPVADGEHLVLHLSRASSAGFTLESLGLHGAALEHVHRALAKRRGLVVVAGPARSGKTTMLYTMLDILNAPQWSLATIEDRIEYRLRQVNQSELNPGAGFTYPRALRGMLKQDADVIMLADIRDKETAALASHAAAMGKLVLAGVNADSATEAIEYLRSLEVDPQLLGSSLSLVIAVRAVPRMEGASMRALSREETTLLEQYVDPGQLLRALKEEAIVPKTTTWRTAQFGSGSSSEDKRIGVQEVIPVHAGIQHLIAEGAEHSRISAATMQEDTLSLAADAVFKSAQGVIGIDEVLSLL